MIKVDLNRISICGLILGAIAALLLTYELAAKVDLRVGKLLGPDVPFAKVPVYWVVALAAIIVYLVGRIVQLSRDRFGMPQRTRRREDDE